jgi:hypothetical protein
MKTYIMLGVIAIVATAAPLHSQVLDKVKGSPVGSQIDETSRFIFYSVLEGLYDDGVSNQDVDQILLKKEKQKYFHFIYACPICTATIWALEAYRSRPEALYSVKLRTSTFGPGLSEPVRAQLYSEDPNQRLIVINQLVKDWIDRRMKKMRLSSDERVTLLAAIEEKRKAGMEALKSFRGRKGEPGSVQYYAPAYLDLDECAVCNGAVGKLMKLPDAKSH